MRTSHRTGRSGTRIGTGAVFAAWTGVSSCGLLPGWRAVHWFLPAPEDFDDAHRAAAARARLAQSERYGLSSLLRFLFGRGLHKQTADAGDGGLAGGAGQQAVVANAVKAVGQDVQQEPADEFAGLEPHHLNPVAALDPVILPSERHSIGIGADRAMVRDLHAVGVPAEIGEDSFRPSEGRFGVDDPFGLADRGEAGGEGCGVGHPRRDQCKIGWPSI